MRHDRRSHRRTLGIGLAGLLAAALVVLVPLTRGRATAPPGRYTINADTVLDTETGLLWQRNIPATPCAGAATCTLAQALGYCEGLSLGGFSDWRLPTIKELQTLVDDRAYNPAIDATAFPATPATNFWSSSPYASNATDAWVVMFYGGYTSYGAVAGRNRVRCVR